jgi:hypothetical protein
MEYIVFLLLELVNMQLFVSITCCVILISMAFVVYWLWWANKQRKALMEIVETTTGLIGRLSGFTTVGLLSVFALFIVHRQMVKRRLRKESLKTVLELSETIQEAMVFVAPVAILVPGLFKTYRFVSVLTKAVAFAVGTDYQSSSFTTVFQRAVDDDFLGLGAYMEKHGASPYTVRKWRGMRAIWTRDYLPNLRRIFNRIKRPALWATAICLSYYCSEKLLSRYYEGKKSDRRGKSREPSGKCAISVKIGESDPRPESVKESETEKVPAKTDESDLSFIHKNKKRARDAMALDHTNGNEWTVEDFEREVGGGYRVPDNQRWVGTKFFQNEAIALCASIKRTSTGRRDEAMMTNSLMVAPSLRSYQLRSYDKSGNNVSVGQAFKVQSQWITVGHNRVDGGSMKVVISDCEYDAVVTDVTGPQMYGDCALVLKVKEPVGVRGIPLGKEPSVNGTVYCRSTFGVSTGKYLGDYKHNCSTTNGWSGCPVLDANNNVVAVHCSTDNNVNYSVPLPNFRNGVAVPSST